MGLQGTGWQRDPGGVGYAKRVKIQNTMWGLAPGDYSKLEGYRRFQGSGTFNAGSLRKVRFGKKI